MAFKLAGQFRSSSPATGTRRSFRRHTLSGGLLGLLTLILGTMSAPAQGPTVYRVSTFAGKVVTESAEVDATTLSLNLPIGLARDSKANLYIADYGNHRIRKVTPAGKATVIAGTGAAGFAGNNGPAIGAQLSFPRTLALDGDKYLYVGESNSARVRRIDLSTGLITVVLGDSQGGFNGDGNPGPATRISEVLGLAVDGQGNLYFADAGNQRIRKLSASDGRVTTIAGTGTAGASTDGVTGASSLISRPGALAVHPNGDIYFSELGNRRIRRIGNGVVTTVAGNAASSIQTGPASQVQITTCIGMAFSLDGNLLYFTEEAADTVRVLNLSNGQVSHIAGNGTHAFAGDNGPAAQAALANPNHIAVEPGGLVVADASNNRIRRIVLGGTISTIAGGSPFTIGDGGPAIQATLNRPATVRFDSRGNLIIVDQGNCLIRRVDTSGRISTVAGTPGTCQLPGLITAFADSQGTIYWTSTQGLFVRGPGDPPQGRLRTSVVFADALLSRDEQQISLLLFSPPTAVIYLSATTAVSGQGPLSIGFAAGGELGRGTDGGSALSNFMFIPRALAADKEGNLYILDNGNLNVRRIDVVKGTISTVVSHAGLVSARGLAVDSSNNILVTVGPSVVKFNPQGELAAVTGGAQPGLTADGLDGTAARFNEPAGIAVSADGRVYVSDDRNHLIRRLTPVTAISMEAINSRPLASGSIPVQVLLKASDGAPLGGLAVQFSVVPAAATLSAPSAETNQNGVATVNVTLAAGQPATVTASVTGSLPPVRIDVTAGGSGAPGASQTPSVSTAISLSGFGGSKRIASGGWVEIYGVNLAAVTQQWAAADFQGGVAPVALGGVRVLMNGIPAFVQSISPSQINCQAPDGLGEGAVSVVVTTAAGSSAPFTMTAAARVPGLLAPAEFRSGARQYVAAIFPDQAFAGKEGLIAGVAFRPAIPGDRITLYGIGFGATIPAVPAGQIATQLAALSNVEVRFGDIPAIVEYAGLAGGFVGVYQLNIVVPEGVSGDVRLTVSAGGVPVEQELWITAN